jgi:ribose 1,5-bisphosphokinase
VSGVFVPVVGPSGAGKDTLIAAAREHLRDDRRFLFVRRTVTRAVGGNEDHDIIDRERFADLVRTGAFVLTWEAHGLCYGIPVSAREATRAGRVAVANLSRSSLATARAIFPAVRTISVTAPAPVLAERLSRRGRESRTEIERRLARTTPPPPAGPDVVVIDNGGELDEAVARLVAVLVDIAGTAGSGQ